MFAILEVEPELQVNDKTRLNASKAFASKAVQDISSLTIKPELSGSAIDCYHPRPDARYLDWVYTGTSIDVGTENDDLKFNEGGADLTATLAAGTYTLSQYATQMATQMTSTGTQTYTGSVSNNKITISAAASFKFLESSAASQAFLELDATNASHTGDTVEYGNKIATLVVSNGTDTDTKYFYLKCYSEAGDRLFSGDGDLIAHEPDILRWVPDGRSSFKNIHRRAQKLIIAWLDEKGFVNTYSNKYDKNDIKDLEEVRQWSTFMTLRLIFSGMSNAIDDVFDRKSKEYSMNEEAARARMILRIDTNKDGIADEIEGLSISSGSLYRR